MSHHRRTSRSVGPLVALALFVSVGLLACSSGDGSDGSSRPTEPVETTVAGDGTGPDDGPAEPERADGPVATVDRELGEGSPFLAAGVSVDLDGAGYVEAEYQLSGTAGSYTGDTPADGFWDLEETGDEGAFTTRIVVRRPAEAADASGVVLLEWLNVSGGLDANPDFAYLSTEILRAGHTWIGVSAQHIGIEGGATAVSLPGTESLTGRGLVGSDEERYGELAHPGDAFAYDLYTQVGRAVRAEAETLLGGIDVEALLAIGESQSAYALTTYANGIQPLTGQFDGFFVHSRGGAGLPVAPPDGSLHADIAGSILSDPVRIRTDLDVPVFMFQAESDVEGILGFLGARQDDTDRIRTWEVAGTAHVDRYMLGPIADLAGCEPDVNSGPHSLTARAALRSLVDWVVDGIEPPTGELLDIGDDGVARRDELGIVRGGIRTPLVDVPVDALRGDAAEGASIFCMLAGRTIPLDDDVLTELHTDAESYLAEFEASADATIDAGFVLPEDRDELLDEAQPDRIP